MRPKIHTGSIMIAMMMVTWVWAGWGWGASPRRIHAVEASCSADTGRHWDSGSGEVMMMIININSKIAMALIMPIMMMIHDADHALSELTNVLYLLALVILTLVLIG